MKKKTIILLLAVCLVGLSACSSGAHMPKHRKQRHCNCPTFSMITTDDSGSYSEI